MAKQDLHLQTDICEGLYNPIFRYPQSRSRVSLGRLWRVSLSSRAAGCENGRHTDPSHLLGRNHKMSIENSQPLFQGYGQNANRLGIDYEACFRREAVGRELLEEYSVCLLQ